MLWICGLERWPEGKGSVMTEPARWKPEEPETELASCLGPLAREDALAFNTNPNLLILSEISPSRRP